MQAGQHEIFMQRCLQLARNGAGYTAPNPMVGSVLVHEGRIISEGFHARYGQAHAEVNCLDAVLPEDRWRIPGSVLYVSLEPCAHHGKTPPCADRIIYENIKTVVVGCRDPFVQVDGKGIEKLQHAGVDVVSGILESECQALNERFMTFHTKGRPWIILKWAQSKDGKVAGAGPQRVYISNDYSNQLGHRWRSEEAAIMVGTNTAIFDNPSLTNRLWTGPNPVRTVLDRTGRLTQDLHLLDGSFETLVLTETASADKKNIRFVQLQPAHWNVSGWLSALCNLGILSVLVEGGPTLHRTFIESGQWDEARVIVNTTLEIGKGLAAPEAPGSMFNTMKLGNDEIRYFRK